MAADPGASGMAQGEGARENVDALLRANFRRSQESLRVLEEASKLVGRDGAAAFKALRFRCYALEKQLDGEMHAKESRRRRAVPGKR